ncbi:hypothetical protein JTB14_020369 [Gonioctena quinquepunctata]|nr:hypothetical protein JTB14_020369 [Gonioctena quinquepunctata]
MSTTEVRRSKRENKGIPPSKYTEGSRHEEKERSKVPSKSKKTNTSSLRRKKLQAELEAEKQLAEISRQELEIQKKLIQKELEVRQAELEESQDLGSTESRESLLLMEELNLGENETELLNMDLEKIRIQQWINNIPSVHTFADKSISFSSRSGRAESFEVVKEVPEVEGMYSVKMSKVNPEKNKDRGVLLRIVPIILSGPEGEYSTFALFDEASTVTLLSGHVADRIGATGQVDPLKIRWTNSITNEEIDSRRVSLGIRGKNENEKFELENVRTVNILFFTPIMKTGWWFIYRSLRKRGFHHHVIQ